MKVSIAMATYNGERFIREQLDSLTAQARYPDELVVTDDGSTDRTMEILEEFAFVAPFPVRVYRNESNLGFSDNFLKAASLCGGDWVAFCDQDDIWLPDKVITLARHAESATKDVLLICHRAEVVDKDLRRSGIKLPKISKLKLVDRHQISPWWVATGFATMVRAELIKDIPHQLRGCDYGDSSRSLTHDQWMTRLATVLGKILMLPDCLALYRRHERATSPFMRSGLSELNGWRAQLRRIDRSLTLLGAEHYQNIASATNSQAKLFRNLADSSTRIIWRVKSAAASIFFEKVSNWFLIRSALYSKKSLKVRVQLFIKLLFSFGYWRIFVSKREMIRALVKDLLVTVMGASAFRPNQRDETP